VSPCSLSGPLGGFWVRPGSAISWVHRRGFFSCPWFCARVRPAS
jgi:hypothetical protein